eukprot:1766711-Alexandrium_andersonii.AAC.1
MKFCQLENACDHTPSSIIDGAAADPVPTFQPKCISKLVPMRDIEHPKPTLGVDDLHRWDRQSHQYQFM